MVLIMEKGCARREALKTLGLWLAGLCLGGCTTTARLLVAPETAEQQYKKAKERFNHLKEAVKAYLDAYPGFGKPSFKNTYRRWRNDIPKNTALLLRKEDGKVYAATPDKGLEEYEKALRELVDEVSHYNLELGGHGFDVIAEKGKELATTTNISYTSMDLQKLMKAYPELQHIPGLREYLMKYSGHDVEVELRQTHLFVKDSNNKTNTGTLEARLEQNTSAIDDIAKATGLGNAVVPALLLGANPALAVLAPYFAITGIREGMGYESKKARLEQMLKNAIKAKNLKFEKPGLGLLKYLDKANKTPAAAFLLDKGVLVSVSAYQKLTTTKALVPKELLKKMEAKGYRYVGTATSAVPTGRLPGEEYLKLALLTAVNLGMSYAIRELTKEKEHHSKKKKEEPEPKPKPKPEPKPKPKPTQPPNGGGEPGNGGNGAKPEPTQPPNGGGGPGNGGPGTTP